MNTLTNAINILNINVNPNEECMICKEELVCSQCYTLPECNHTYHTNCLITWFRNGDSRCPYCGNKGINNKDASLSRLDRSKYYSLHYEKQSLIDIKKIVYLKKYDTDKNCLNTRKLFDKINVLEAKYKSECEKYNEFKQSLKLNPTLYNEAKKKMGKMSTKKWHLAAQIRLEKYKIVNNSYIIPLIIPLTVSV